MTDFAKVALIDEVGSIGWASLTDMAAALTEDLHTNFYRDWPRAHRAQVQAYPDVPMVGTWSIRIRTRLDEPDALGYHTDELNTPVAYVMKTADTSVTVSHELKEMLADPHGNLMHGGRLPYGLEDSFRDFGLKSQRSRVRFLFEVADPPESRSYEVGGIAMSDHVTRDWYHSDPQVAVAYSFAGACSRPRQVAPGGYVSFMVPASREWFQAFADGPKELTVRDIGRFDRLRHASLREFTDHHARRHRADVAKRAAAKKD